MLKAVNRSIEAAVAKGIIDRNVQAAPICAMRILAEQLDDPDWPIIHGGKLDNVSLPTMLRYCQALGIALIIDGKRVKASKDVEPKEKPRNDFDDYLNSHRIRRA